MPTVLITREHAAPLSNLLTERGLASVHVPMLRLVGTGAHPPVGAPSQVLVTSAAAVRFAPDLSGCIMDAEVVAVGPATAAALEARGLSVRAVGQGGGLAALELLHSGPGVVWYLGAEQPSPGLDAALTARGVTRWIVYRAEMQPTVVADEGLDVVVFTSGRTIEAYVEANGRPRLPVVVLGPTTLEVAEQHGVRVSACAERPTLMALADAVATVV